MKSASPQTPQSTSVTPSMDDLAAPDLSLLWRYGHPYPVSPPVNDPCPPATTLLEIPDASISRTSCLPPFLLGITFWLAAGIVRFLVAPAFEELPADYANELHVFSKAGFRTSADAKWDESDQKAIRIEQTLASSREVLKIHSNMTWTTESGEVAYQTSGVYGVDRRTRMNRSGYGNRERSGQYLFPPRTEKKTYQLWDPGNSGPRAAVFSHVEVRNGLELYVFNDSAKDWDDTDGYLFVPDVPARYRVVTDAEGQRWIEPRTGIMVDFHDVGASSFIHPTTRERIAEFSRWTDAYTPETIASQMRLALTTRRRLFALEFWIPVTLGAAGMIAMLFGGHAISRIRHEGVG